MLFFFLVAGEGGEGAGTLPCIRMPFPGSCITIAHTSQESWCPYLGTSEANKNGCKPLRAPLRRFCSRAVQLGTWQQPVIRFTSPGAGLSNIELLEILSLESLKNRGKNIGDPTCAKQRTVAPTQRIGPTYPCSHPFPFGFSKGSKRKPHVENCHRAACTKKRWIKLPSFAPHGLEVPRLPPMDWRWANPCRMYRPTIPGDFKFVRAGAFPHGSQMGSPLATPQMSKMGSPLAMPQVSKQSLPMTSNPVGIGPCPTSNLGNRHENRSMSLPNAGHGKQTKGSNMAMFLLGGKRPKGKQKGFLFLMKRAFGPTPKCTNPPGCLKKACVLGKGPF